MFANASHAVVRFIAAISVMLLLVTTGRAYQDFVSSYKGLPYNDSRVQSGPQIIPGRVQCAYYDLGGEGIAYHDTTPKNEGSGGLNPADGTYLNEFRMQEAVDTSYTKFHDAIDNNPYDKVTPELNQLYVGWTQPGEWFNITVNAAHTGSYSADLLYTSNRGGTISIDVNGRDVTGPIAIQSTYDARDPIAWRQWHHWNVMKNLTHIPLKKGRNVLTVHILTEGNMNFAYFDFKPSQ
ncbi:hypothetical protein ACFPT7_20650 [Acidicapsa dinghuensis]|uniref:CBM6 domain-containing protein n=1 Tax=Acidicapsa dinghuensis TaxID=2218256 RepID=A0ABW1EKB0_9BACT|nr:hypothetical protein [Acidicapsa dinghuensis]